MLPLGVQSIKGYTCGEGSFTNKTLLKAVRRWCLCRDREQARTRRSTIGASGKVTNMAGRGSSQVVPYHVQDDRIDRWDVRGGVDVDGAAVCSHARAFNQPWEAWLVHRGWQHDQYVGRRRRPSINPLWRTGKGWAGGDVCVVQFDGAPGIHPPCHRSDFGFVSWSPQSFTVHLGYASHVTIYMNESVPWRGGIPSTSHSLVRHRAWYAIPRGNNGCPLQGGRAGG